MPLNLPVLNGGLDRTRRATPKLAASLAKLARAQAKAKRLRDDARKLAHWAAAVKARDGWRDRMTGQPVKPRAHVLTPDAAHAHHLAGRADVAVRYDVRNGICLSAATHAQVEAGTIRIVGTRWYTVQGRRYINADYPVRFVRRRP